MALCIFLDDLPYSMTSGKLLIKSIFSNEDKRIMQFVNDTCQKMTNMIFVFATNFWGKSIMFSEKCLCFWKVELDGKFLQVWLSQKSFSNLLPWLSIPLELENHRKVSGSTQSWNLLKYFILSTSIGRKISL